MNDIIALIKDFLTRAGIPFSDITTEIVLDQTVFSIVSPEKELLIGRGGETLRAIEYVVKKMAEQKKIEVEHFSLDAGGYKKTHIDDLQKKAKVLAERAKSFEYDVEMSPMNAYDRLIIHSSLSGLEHIKTESIGDGMERRVVIKYVR